MSQIRIKIQEKEEKMVTLWLDKPILLRWDPKVSWTELTADLFNLQVHCGVVNKVRKEKTKMKHVFQQHKINSCIQRS